MNNKGLQKPLIYIKKVFGNLVPGGDCEGDGDDLMMTSVKCSIIDPISQRPMTDPVIKIYFRPLQRYTVGARIPSIRIPNTFENRTFSCFVLGWFGFRMVRSSKYTAETDHSKTQLSNMAALS